LFRPADEPEGAGAEWLHSQSTSWPVAATPSQEWLSRRTRRRPVPSTLDSQRFFSGDFLPKTRVAKKIGPLSRRGWATRTLC
jgi:hypothetical protein